MRVSTLCFALLAFSHGSLASDNIPYHHLALFLGYGVEEKKDHDEDTSAVGLEYEYRFSDNWGVGAVYEQLGDDDTIRDEVVVIPVSLHLGHGWRFFAGPGYESHSSSNADKSHDECGTEGEHKHKDKFLLRLGAGYEFKIGQHWSIAPEFLVDAIETGDNTWLAGIAFGYHF
jgi:opacity protein-like surface antigen